MKVNIQKLARVITPILVFALLLSLVVPASASSNPAYVDVTPVDHYALGGFSEPIRIPLNLPEWFQNTGYSSVPMRIYVIGAFRGSYPYSPFPGGSTLVSVGDIDSASSVYEKVYTFTLDAGYQSFLVGIDGDTSVTPYFEIHHVYAELPGWEGTLSTAQYSFGTLTSGYSNVTLPFSVTDLSTEHYFRVPSSMLGLSDSVTFDFAFSAPNVLGVSVFSGSNQVDFINGFDNNGRITVSGYNPTEDLTVCLYGEFTSLKLNSVSVYYGLLLDETGLLSLINESLNSNFQDLQDLLATQHEETKGILNDILSWLSSMHNIIDSGFKSVGNWFTTLWNNVSGGFTNVGAWIQAQTDTLSSKFDELINGTQAQQQAAQQAQQNANNLQQNVDNASSDLAEVGNALDSVAKPDVNMSLDGFGVDYSSLITLTAPLTQDRTIGAIMGIMAVLMLLSFVIFGKKG